MKSLRHLTLLFLLMCIPLASAQVRLPRLIGDGMVLQRELPLHLWGWAAPGESLTLHFLGMTRRATADAQGRWQVTLPPQKAGGPYAMEIVASNRITLQNILVGDVWICSGQSNMALPMERVKERYPEVIAGAENPAIRHFFVPMVYHFKEPQRDLPSGHWEAATPRSVLNFTAVGYFFARELYNRYHVPIGLINASVGGSPAEAWISAEGLKAFPDHLTAALQCRSDGYVDSIRAEEQARSDAWYARVQKEDPGLTAAPPWSDPRVDDSAWPVMTLPGFWADAAPGPVLGVVWFRREFTLPDSLAGCPARLFLGRIVDSDFAYINGRCVGMTSYQYPPRRYTVPAGVLQAGRNTLAVRVVNKIGRGGFVPDKRYELITAAGTIDLQGSWRYRVGVVMETPLPDPTFFQWKPLGLYNGMIAPLASYGIKGVIWYQGEANTSRPAEYRTLFPALIADWRRHWQQGSLPFLYVQLPNFMESRPEPGESRWAELRFSQLQSLMVPKTGMAVAIDIGEWNDIHPLNKEEVGRRLALAARRIAFGEKKLAWSGPLYRAMKVQGNRIVLTFDHADGGLVARGGGAPGAFAVCGADGKFVWAKAEIRGDKVEVWSEAIVRPVAVRYAWADNPAGANLCNAAGLPAAPFTTESWPGGVRAE
ncbi:MAG TPA: sialate O-acetylesterase [bacterium]|nr:sialate O-acetylesterase [bacterium]HPR87067.1 sialate O-acetylesterase [bacterium]